MVCGDRGTVLCPDCGKLEKKESSFFCANCIEMWHKHKDRRHHKLVVNNDGTDPGRLQLLSVLCVEANHYVCFTRVQRSGTNYWVFFDSIAERIGEQLQFVLMLYMQ